MKLTLSSVLLLSLALLTSAQWIGFTAEPNQPQNVSIFFLNHDAQRQNTIANFKLPFNEHIADDSFRCRPYGTFCLFTTYDGESSYLYNVTLDGFLTSKAYIAGALAHNLHLDHTTGGAYSVSIGEKVATVIGVLYDDVYPIVDLTPVLQDGDAIPAGGTTQCSDTNTVWVFLSNPKGSRMVVVDLPSKSIDNIFSTQGQEYQSLWASCINKGSINTLAGISISADNSSVLFGTIEDTGNAAGTFNKVSSVLIPDASPPLRPNGLMSQPYTYDFFFALYPEGATIGGPPTSGYLVYGYFKHGPLTVSPIPYYLTGAARTR